MKALAGFGIWSNDMTLLTSSGRLKKESIVLLEVRPAIFPMKLSAGY